MSDVKEKDGNISVKKIRKHYFGGTFWPGMFILAILLLISFVILGFRLTDYANRDNREVLLKSNMDAELDIFSVTYQNSRGEIIIEGADGEKVIAPGTDVDYTVRLRNKDTIAIDYTLIAQVTTVNESETSNLELPIVYRILDPEDDYLAGDYKTWVTQKDVDGLSHSSTLMRNESAEYLFQWKWPYEGGNDEYDTFLGNSESDIALKITFVLRSEANTSIAANGGLWASGAGKIILIIIFALLLLLAIILLIIAYFRRKRVETVVEPEPVIVIPEPVVEPEPIVEPEPEPEPVVIKPIPLHYSYAGKKYPINIDEFTDYFEDGATINLAELKSRGLVPNSVKLVKILARDDFQLDKIYYIEAHGASANAVEKIKAAGGKITILRENVKTRKH